MMRRLLTVLAFYIFCLGAPGVSQRVLAEQQSRLSVQARPFSSVTVQAADGSSIAAMPFAAAWRFPVRHGGKHGGGATSSKPSPTGVSVLLLYGVLGNATRSQLNDLSRRLAPLWTARLTLLAPAGRSGAVGRVSPLNTGVPGMRWLPFGERVAIPSGAVDVHVLPREPDTYTRTLAVVHVKVPYMELGVAYPVAPQAVKTRAPEVDVLIVDLDQLRADDLSSRTLAMLDPGMAIIIDGAQRLRQRAELTEFADRLYELWIDVYTVDSSTPFVVTADSRGVILPLHGRHA